MCATDPPSDVTIRSESGDVQAGEVMLCEADANPPVERYRWTRGNGTLLGRYNSIDALQEYFDEATTVQCELTNTIRGGVEARGTAQFTFRREQLKRFTFCLKAVQLFLRTNGYALF